MSQGDRFSILLTVISMVGALMVFLCTIIWRVSKHWTSAGMQMSALANEIRSLVKQKEREHARLQRTDDRLEKRIDRLDTRVFGRR